MTPWLTSSGAGVEADLSADPPADSSTDPSVACGDAGCCPLCGQANGCARAVDSASDAADCWCRLQRFPADWLARVVPGDAVGLRCICAACVQAEIDRG